MAPGLGLLRRILCHLGPVLLLLSASVSGDVVGDLQTKGRTQINAQLAKSTTCTASKLMVRKEW